MSTTTKGGASLRLVTGLTFAGLVVCGVIAASLHRAPLASCTMVGRGSNDVVAKDILHVHCTGLTGSTAYTLETSTDNGWEVTTARGSGTGADINNALAFTQGSSGSHFTSYTTGFGETEFNLYVLTAQPSGSSASNSLTLKAGGSTVATTPSRTIYQTTASWFSTTLNNPPTDKAEMDLTGYQSITGEKYMVKVTSGLPGFDNTGITGNPTNGLSFDTSGSTATNTVLNFVAATKLNTLDPATDQTSCQVTITDENGNVLTTLGGLRINHI